jgi:hypothetical protein
MITHSDSVCTYDVPSRKARHSIIISMTLGELYKALRSHFLLVVFLFVWLQFYWNQSAHNKTVKFSPSVPSVLSLCPSQGETTAALFLTERPHYVTVSL